MICNYAEIFCWKNVSSFCSAKATHIFSAKNIRILCIESAKTVNEMTLNELVKLTTLWTTGPSILRLCVLSQIQQTTFWISEKYGLTFHADCALRSPFAWTIFWEKIRKISPVCYLLILPSPFCWFKKGSCQFPAKECAQVLVNCLED